MPAHTITDALLTHFDATKRDMPWRETSDPYAIWVSEVMLQQTRVDTVIPYWTDWMDRFPTVETLADAALDEVLKRWEGLGYYSRARNLHGAARMVRERFNGRLPEETDALRELPGVGEYTAGAVASIAFGVPTPAVDGNVRRVVSRLYDLEAPTPAQLRERAAALVPKDRPGDFNQALMELGATVCTPTGPDCGACPVAEWCRARELGVQELRPRPRDRKPVPEVTVHTAVIVRDDGAFLLARRPTDGLLGGLWEFPGDEGDGWPPSVAALMPAGQDPDSAGAASARLRPVVHAFSHKRVTYVPFLVQVEHGGLERAPDAGSGVDLAWVAPGALDEFALPVAQRKIAERARAWIDNGGGPEQ